ncbi:hypothetical protein AKG09_10190 [Neisseria sp. 83E34]|nr:hypothetical protein AKG09_10190 [Neisseria sp. 83E34]
MLSSWFEKFDLLKFIARILYYIAAHVPKQTLPHNSLNTRQKCRRMPLIYGYAACANPLLAMDSNKIIIQAKCPICLLILIQNN